MKKEAGILPAPESDLVQGRDDFRFLVALRLQVDELNLQAATGARHEADAGLDGGAQRAVLVDQGDIALRNEQKHRRPPFFQRISPSRTARHAELARGLRVGEPARELAQHIDFTCGQADVFFQNTRPIAGSRNEKARSAGAVRAVGEQALSR